MCTKSYIINYIFSEEEVEAQKVTCPRSWSKWLAEPGLNLDLNLMLGDGGHVVILWLGGSYSIRVKESRLQQRDPKMLKHSRSYFSAR